MRRISIGAVMAAALVVVVASRSAIRDDSSPSNGTLIYDGGPLVIEATDGERRSLTLSVQNPGKSPVRIKSIRASCGCVLVKVPQNPIVGAGANIAIQLSVNPPRRGTRHVWLAIESDTLNATPLVITIDVRGEQEKAPLLVQVPDTVELVGFEPGARLERTVRINTLESVNTPPWIIGAICTDPEIELRLLQSTNGERQGELIRRNYSFSVGAVAPSFSHVARTHDCKLLTSDEGAPQIAGFPVRTRLGSPVFAIPGELLIEVAATETAIVTRKVLLRSREDAPWRVTEIRTNVAWLDALIDPENTASEADRSPIRILLLHLRPGDFRKEPPQGVLSATITVLLEHPLLKKVEIPVTVHCNSN